MFMPRVYKYNMYDIYDSNFNLSIYLDLNIIKIKKLNNEILKTYFSQYFL